MTPTPAQSPSHSHTGAVPSAHPCSRRSACATSGERRWPKRVMAPKRSSERPQPSVWGSATKRTGGELAISEGFSEGVYSSCSAAASDLAISEEHKLVGRINATDSVGGGIISSRGWRTLNTTLEAVPSTTLETVPNTTLEAVPSCVSVLAVLVAELAARLNTAPSEAGAPVAAERSSEIAISVCAAGRARPRYKGGAASTAEAEAVRLASWRGGQAHEPRGPLTAPAGAVPSSGEEAKPLYLMREAISGNQWSSRGHLARPSRGHLEATYCESRSVVAL